MEGDIAKLSSTHEDSINHHDSAYLEKGEQSHSSEKALEAAAPKYDESKILQGRKLLFAFVAMLLSVLLIALGAFPLSIIDLSKALIYCTYYRPNHYCTRAVRKPFEHTINNETK
jgi:hypothetical protein